MKFCFAADGSNLATQDRKIALVQGEVSRLAVTEGLLGTEKSVVKLFFLHSYRQGRKRTVCGCKDDSLNVKQNCRRLQGL